MKCLRALGLATILMLWGAVTAGAQTPPDVTLSLPQGIEGSVGTDVIIPLVLATNTPIRSAQAVIEYDNSVIQFVGAAAAPNVPGTVNVNDDLTYPPDDVNSGATDNVLVQWTGSASVSGNLKLILMRFAVVGNPGQTSTLTLNPTPNRTNATTNNPIQTLSGGDLTVEHGFFQIPPQNVIELRIPQISTATPGQPVQVPVLLSTGESVGALQVTLEYDTTELTFVDAQPGADANAAGFGVSNINTNLTFTRPTDIDDVLIQLSGGGAASLSGDAQEVLLLTFNLAAGAVVEGNFIPIKFDIGGERTNVSTIDPLRTFRSPGLALVNGGIGQSDAGNIRAGLPDVFFDQVQVGQFTDRVVGIFNDGSSPIAVTDVRIEGFESDQFLILNPGPFSIGPNGGVFDINLRFQPQYVSGFIGAELVVQSNDPDTPQLRIGLGGSSASGLDLFNISANPSDGPRPLDVGFGWDAAGVDDGTEFQWDFGDGTGSGDRNPTHVYNSLGQFTVRLTVRGSGGEDFAETTVNVFNNPPFIGDLGPRTAPFNTQVVINLEIGDDFTPPDQLQIAVDKLNLGSLYGAVIDGQSVILTPNPNTAFVTSVRIRVTDGDGAVTERTVEVNWTAEQISGIIEASPVKGPPPLGVSFNFVTTQEVLSYSWDFGDGTGSSDGPATFHEYVNPDNYQVSLTITSPAGPQTFNLPQPIEVVAPLAGDIVADPPTGTAPLDVRFDFQPFSDSGPIDSYTWFFGDGSPEVQTSEPFVNHLYEVSGAFNVQVRIANTATGQEFTVIRNNLVQTGASLPSGQIVANPPSGGAPLGVAFEFAKDPASGPVESFEWTFGDGSPPDGGAQPFHEFLQPGTYEVNLTVFGAGSQSVQINPVTILVGQRKPEGDFVANPNTGTAPLEVQFVFNAFPESGPIDVISWEFGDGATGEGPNPIHLYNEPGSYSVSVTATGPGGELFIPRDNLVEVAQAGDLVANFVMDPPEGRAPLFVQFTDQTIGAVGDLTYAWNFGDPNTDQNTSSDPNPGHVFNLFGEYEVSLTVTDGQGRQSTKTRLVRALAAQPVLFVEANVTQGFAPLEVVFNSVVEPRGPNLGPVTFDWNFGDGTPGDTSPNPVHLFQQPGLYFVNVVVRNPDGEDRQEIQINVQPPQSPQGFIVIDPPSGFAPMFTVFRFEPGPESGAITNYAWDFGDGGSSTGPNPAYTYTTPGVYEPTLTLTGPGGEVTLTAPPVDVREVAGIIAEFDAPATVQVQEPVVFLNRSSGQGELQFVWEFNDPESGAFNSSTQRNPDHIFATFGDYLVKLTVVDELGRTQTIEKIIQVLPPELPPVSIFGEPSVGFVPFEVRFESSVPVDPVLAGQLEYQWNFGDGQQSSEPNPVHVYQQPGEFSAQLRVIGPGGESFAEFPISAQASVPPGGDIAATQNTGFAPMPVGFDYIPAPGSGKVDNFAWNFGDGATFESPDPFADHVYELPGVYNVSLTVTGPGGENTIVRDGLVEVQSRFPVGSFTARPASGLAPLNVTFNSQLFPDSGPVDQITWAFGDGGTATGPNPSYIYQTPGTYDVTMTLTGPGGENPVVRPGLVVVTQPGQIVANFQINPPEGPAPLTVRMSNQSQGEGPLRFEWDFGDGLGSGEKDPQHVYNIFGDYDITLTVTEIEGQNRTATLTRTVRVLPQAPQVAIGADQLSGIAPLTVAFESNVPAGANLGDLSYEWAFGDGILSSNPNPVHTFEQPGQYPVILRVFGPGGEASADLNIDVRLPDVPTGVIQASVLSGPPPLNVEFRFIPNATSGPIFGYQWNFGPAGGATQPNPIRTFNTPGEYPVSLTLFGPGGENTINLPQPIQVLSKLPAGTIKASPQAGAAPLSTVFFFEPAFESGPVDAFLWTFGDGTTSAEPNPSKSYTTPGIYNVSLTLTGPGGEVTLVRDNFVTVTQPGELVANFTVNPPEGRVPLTVRFEDGSSGGTNLTYRWEFGDPVSGPFNVSTQRNPSHSYNVFGTYFARLTVTDNLGRTAVTERQVTVKAAQPTVNIQADKFQGRAPLVVKFNSNVGPQGPNLGPVSYLWSFGNGRTDGSSAPSVTYNDPGVYPVTLKVTTPGGTAQAFLEIVVDAAQKPAGIIIAEPNIGQAPLPVRMSFLPNTNSGKVTGYRWNFGDGTTSTEPNPLKTYTTPGRYTVSLTAIGPGGETTIVQQDLVQIQLRPPAGVIEATPASGPAPHNVNFAFLPSRTSGPIDEYIWDFGDGTGDAGPNPVHEYTVPGLYTVSVLATGPGGELARSRTNLVAVSEPGALLASFGVNVESGRVPLGVSFNNQTVGEGLTYQWDFADPESGPLNVSTQRNPNHNYNRAGTFVARLTVRDNVLNREAFAERTIRVQSQAPVVTVIATPTSGIAPLDVAFTSSVRNLDGGTLLWDFGDGTTSEEPNPFHLFEQPGVYPVSLTATGPGGQTRVVRNVEVLLPPLPSGFVAADPTSGFAPLDVGFAFEPDPASGPIDTFLWNFGDGTSSPDPAPVHLYEAAGLYRASLTISGPGGDAIIDLDVPIEVTDQAPDGEIVADPVAGFAPLAVNFELLPSPEAGPVESVTWDFGDGGTATGFAASYTYNDPGTYSVEATLEGPGGRTFVLRENLVDVSATGDVVAGFTFSPNEGRAPVRVTFAQQALGAGDLTYAWDFGDPNSGSANTSTAPSPAHTYNIFGDYPVTLTVTDALARTATKTQVVRVRPVQPVVSVSADRLSGVAPLSVTFGSTVGPAGPNLGQFTYSWNFDDGGPTASVAKPKRTFTEPGVYEVGLTVSSLGGRATAKVLIDVLAPPAPAGRITAAPTAGVAPLPVAFAVRRNATSGPITSYAWDFGDGATGEGLTPAHTYETPGVYTVSLTLLGPGGETQLTQVDMIEVGAAGEVIANFNTSVDRGVAPLTVSFTDASSGSGALQFFWNFGDPNSGPLNAGTQPQPTHTYQAIGDYLVTLTVTDATGRTASKDKLIQVVPPKPVVFINGAPLNGMAPLTVAFQSKVGPAQVTQGALRYAWKFGDGTTSTETNPTKTYAEPGTYPVSLTVTGAGGVGVSQTLNVTVVAPALPSGAFAAAPTSGFVPLDVAFAFEPDATSGPIDAFLWEFGDGGTADVPDPVYTYAAPGTYTVSLTLTGPGGETTLVEEDLVVVSQPGQVVANFAATPATGPAPLSVAFRSNSEGTGILTYAWDFDDPESGDANSSTSLGPNHTFNTFGTYNVALVVTDGLGQTGTIVKPIVVTAPKPVVQIAADVKEGIAPLDVSFTSTVGPSGVDLGELTYLWEFGDNGTASTPEVTHTFTAAGTHTVKLTVTGPDAVGTASTAVSVLFPNRPPSAPVFSSPANGAEAQPLTLPLVWQPSTDPDQDAVTYRILLGAGQAQPSALASGIAATSFTIGPLAQNTLYTAQVVAVDTRGAAVPGSQIRFTTQGDVTPPTFTQKAFVTQTGPTSALVRWQTNEPSTSQVRFGVQGAGLNLATDETDAAGVTDHRADLLGLQPGATYEFQAVSKDVSPNANVGEGAVRTFTVVQQTLTALAFSSDPVVLNRTPTTATVFWKTNRISSTLGDILGATQRAAKQAASAAFTGAEGEDHTLILDRLIPNTDYRIEVRSADAAGTVVRRSLNLTTPPAETVVPPPTVSDAGVISTTESEAVVAWKTDVPATSVVRFGLAPELGVYNEITGDPNVIDHQVTVSGLEPGTPYYLQPVSANSKGESLGPILSTTTLAVPDTTPPVILEDPVPLGITQTSVTVKWSTDKASSSEVTITGPEGALTPVFSPEPVIDHLLTVSGLTAGTNYTLQVNSVGAASGLSVSSDPFVVTTLAQPDLTPPVILSGPGVPKPEPTSLKVTWVTDEPATSIVEFAPEGGAFEERVDPALGKDHKVLLTNLTPGTNYTIRVRSKDLANNESETRETAVQTKALAAADKKAPKITTPPGLVSSTDVTATIAWTTDEEANGIVRFGTSADALDGQRGNATDFSIDHRVQLTGLTPGTEYFYRVASTDPLQNGPTESDVQTFTTRAAPDTRSAQVVSGPITLSTTKTSATVDWGTDESGDSRVEYAVGDALGGDVQVFVDGARSQSHTVTLSGLTPGTLYSYRVGSQDVARNPVVFSEVKTFTTEAEAVVIPPPQILSGPQVATLSPDAATIEWETDKPTTGIIEYGVGDYGNRLESGDLSNGHSFTLAGLDPNTAYIYRVSSKDQDGKLVTTDPTLGDAPEGVRAQRQDLGFTTPTAPDVTPPVILDGPSVDISGSNVTVSWTTDEPATGVVVYGTAAEFGDPALEQRQVQDESGLSLTHTVTLKGLDLNNRYFYKVESTDAENNTVTFNPLIALAKRANPSATLKDIQAAAKRQPPGGLGSFLTDTSADTQQPLILNGPTQASASANDLVINWDTDEVTTPTVRYKPVAGSGAAKAAKQGVTAERVIELAAAQTSHQILLNNLDPNTRYAYTVEVADLSGNRTVSGEAYASTTSEADVTPPKLVGSPRLVYLTDRSATISWELDELADGALKYGVKGEGLTASRVASDNSKTPSITLTNLQPNTTYEYQVASSDLNRNGPTESTVLSFTTEGVPDLDPPQILGPAEVVAVTDQSATIRWQTNELADRAIRYGANQSLDLVAGSATDDVTHVVTLSNLERGTAYAFQVESTDASGNGPTFGAIRSFTTLATADTDAPAVPQGLLALAGASDVVLTWQANAETDLVGYDVLRAVGDGAFETIATRVTATQFRDTGLEAGTTYRYTLIAVDQASNKSVQSDAQSAAPDAGNVLSAPNSAGATGEAAAAVLSVFNVTPIRDGSTMTYEFQISTREDFSDIVTATSGLAEGSNTTKAGYTDWPVDRALQGDLTYYWRVRANDGFFDGAFSDAQKLEFGVVIVNTGDFDNNGVVGFSDFILFARGFGLSQGQTGFNAVLDLDGDGKIAFNDFIQFARVFGTTYASGKLGVIELPEDLNASVILKTDLNVPKKGQTFEVTVDLSGVQHPGAYGMELWYDDSRVTYLDASAPEGAPLFGVLKEEAGHIWMGGQAASSDAETNGLAVLTFRILNDPGTDPLVGIADLVIDDLDGRMRRVVDRAGLDLKPTEFALYPVYPNPFNPVTTIPYAVPEASEVRLAVYNILGQEVVELIRSEHQPGHYRIAWAGRDAAGRSVASGVYLVRMQAGSFSQVNKMILMK